MTKKTEPKSLQELLDFLDDDLLFGPINLAKDELQEAGADPTEIGALGAAFLKGLAEERRLAWRMTATQRLQVARSQTRRASSAMDRSTLVGLVNKARMDERNAAQLRIAFRGRKPEEADEEELLGFLEDIGILERLEDED